MAGRFSDPMFTILIIRYLSSPFFQTGFYSFSLHSCTCILAIGIAIITVVSIDCVGIILASGAHQLFAVVDSC